MDRFKLPSWARDPQLDNAALVVMKGGKQIGKISRVSKNRAVVFGRNKSFADVILQHPSISRQHAVILHGKSGNMYVMDLKSSHGSFVNKRRLKPESREPLFDGDIIRFGGSSREYMCHLSYDGKSRKRRAESSGDKRSKKKRKKVKKEKEKTTEEAGENVGCCHLLVKHKDSRRPSSWKEEEITRTAEEAVTMIKEYKKEIEGSDDVEAKFKELASKNSDCNSHSRGGDLGKFKKGKMQKPFEECAFALKVGELSDPVDTASGVHLIYRTS